MVNRIVPNANIMTAFRNARMGNGVIAVSAQDFQRGAFRNQIAVSHAQLLQGSLARGAVPVTPTASNLRFSDRPVSAAAIPRNEAGGNQRFFSRMPAASAAQRTSFTQQQAAVRSAFGGGASGGGAQSQSAGSGWRRFGEPSQPQSRSFQSTGGANSGGAGAGWDRFGSPQRSFAPAATPQQSQYSRPPVYYGSGSGQSRAVQVAPPIVQQRSAPAPSYQGAPQGGQGGSRGGGGGHSSGGHGGGRR
jgi:hypothetical protein